MCWLGFYVPKGDGYRMKTEKVTMTILVEVLSVDVVPGLVHEALDIMRRETPEGQIIKDDGDMVTWCTDKKRVEF